MSFRERNTFSRNGPASPPFTLSNTQEDSVTDQADIEAKFWKAVESDRTMMVGRIGVEDSMGQPMTAQLDDEKNGKRRGPIYFFTAKDTDLAREIGERHRAVVNFAA